MHNLAFNYRKATQALNFLTRRGDGLTKLTLLKLIYFADRYHLRKYGRAVTNDQYWAMQFGPVASSVKEIAELDSLGGSERHYAMKYLTHGVPADGEKEFLVKSRAEVDEGVFSASDLEALSFAWDTFGGKQSALVNITHKYPEWLKHEGSLKGGQSRVQMDLLDFFDDPVEPGTNPCWPLNAEMRATAKQCFAELNRVERIWR